MLHISEVEIKTSSNVSNFRRALQTSHPFRKSALIQPRKELSKRVGGVYRSVRNHRGGTPARASRALGQFEVRTRLVLV